MVKIGTIAIDLIAKTGKLLKPLKQSRDSMAKTSGAFKRMGTSAKAAGLKMMSFGKSIGGSMLRNIAGFAKAIGAASVAMIGLGGALSAGGLVARSLKLGANMETAQIAFTTFLKDAGKAKKMLADLKKFSDATPFTGEEIRDAGRQLLAFGFGADEIVDTLRILGDAAAAGQKPIADFVDIFGKAKAAGVVSLGDIMRLADRGVSVFPLLSKQLRITSGEVRTFISAGKLKFGDLQKMMIAATTGTGLAAGAMKNLSESTTALVGTLSTKIDAIFAEVGTKILEGLNLKGLTKELISLAEEYKQTVVDSTIEGVRVLKQVLGELPVLAKKFQDSRTKLSENVAVVKMIFDPSIKHFNEVIESVGKRRSGGSPDPDHDFSLVRRLAQREKNRKFVEERELERHKQTMAEASTTANLLARAFTPSTEQAAGIQGMLGSLFSGGGALAKLGAEDPEIAKGKALADLIGKGLKASGLDKLPGATRDLMSRAKGGAVDFAVEAAARISTSKKTFKAFDGPIAAVQRGSQEALSAILATQDESTVEKDQLTELRKAREMWRAMFKKSPTLIIADLTGAKA